MLLLIRGASQLVQVSSCHAKYLLCKDISENGVSVLRKRSDDGLSIVIDNDGLIKAVGFDSDIKTEYDEEEFERVIEADGKCILPGFIDAHTHPVFAGDRVHEFAMKLAGATYMDVHKAGGGINFTVQHVRSASEAELFQSLKDRLERMMMKGTTTIECKSGYGLDWNTELKMLRVLNRARSELPVDISVTYLGAHAIPRGSSPEAATGNIVERQIPALVQQMATGQLHVDNIDVFCEQGVFDVELTRRILKTGLDAGLRINFHADELHPIGGAELAREMPVAAISHLEEISDAGISAMAERGSVGVLLPTTAYILRLAAPPARKMLDAGVPIAIGSDFNPNAFCMSMPMVMHLACVLFGMTMEESFVGATLNAAASLGLSASHGSLEVGKVGDIVLMTAPRWEHIIYQFGEADNLISHVIKGGKIVHCTEF